MRKSIATALIVSALVLAGCAQGQVSSSAQDSEASAASASTAAAGSVAGSGEDVGASNAAGPSEPAGSASANAFAENGVFVISANGTRLEVTPADTEAARVLMERLQAGPVTVDLRAYGGFEKVGPLPWALPANDAQVTAQPGDVMLYQGDQITVFTGSNSWAYTPFGNIEGATPELLLGALGDGDVQITLSLA